MNIKNYFKSVMGKNCYIAKGVNIKNGKLLALGSNVSLRPNVEIFVGRGISIGNGTDIGTRSRISCTNICKIGSNVLISPNVYITDCDHRYDMIEIPIISQGVVEHENFVEIGDDSYLGINSVLVGNIKIGKHVVVGANSVVTKNVPDFCVVAGVPAKVIKRYNIDIKDWI